MLTRCKNHKNHTENENAAILTQFHRVPVVWFDQTESTHEFFSMIGIQGCELNASVHPVQIQRKNSSDT